MALALAFILPAQPALACKPGDLEYEIRFGSRDSTMEAWQIRSFVEWYSFKRLGDDQTKGIGEVDVFARSIKGSEATHRLARERVSNIMRLIKAAGGPALPPVVPHISKLNRTPTSEYTVDTVIVGIQPVCLRTQSCCPTALK